jgi:hypothetical protein
MLVDEPGSAGAEVVACPRRW